MKRVVLPCLVVLASLVAAPQASAAACQYVKQDLPVPAGAGDVLLNGSSSNNSRIVGHLTVEGNHRAVYWANGTLRHLAPAPNGEEGTVGLDVNNTGVVTGYLLDYRGQDPAVLRPFRYENGAYEQLSVGEGTYGMGQAINDAGDIAGKDDGGVYLWPRGGARKLIAANGGDVIGLTNDGKIVVRASSSVKVYDANGGPTVDIPGGAAGSAVMDNDRVFLRERDASGELVTSEYDLTGARITSHPVQGKLFGRNGSGTVWGMHVQPGTTTQNHALWRSTGRTDLVADPMPLTVGHNDITDAATLIGTYRSGDGLVRPARWLWVCS
ncbi:hypothetical protein JNUCC0626_04900 [Lentzea sp. JNUCC 0626]|uniref:hypothetical protein n=1 Tax=Lentzea sp. JNUCC 0626 TaxID=3367513 RepID=UPI003748E515